MITKMLTLNTVHLSEETLEMLADESVLEEAGAHKEKQFPLLQVYCVGHPNITGVTYIIDADRDKIGKMLDGNDRVPADLHRVLQEAFAEWCDTIRLHDNGQVYIDLPKYDCD